MKYQAYFPRFRQDIADLLSDVEKSLSVGVWCNLQDKFYVICEISAQHLMSYKRCQGLEGTVPLSTRPTWSEWTSGTTSSSATWAGGALTNTSKIQTQVLIDHPGNFFIFFRVETLLRHAHFSIQSRRLWKQFDSEVRRLLDPFLLVQHKNNGKHDFTHWQKAFLLELSNKRRWNWAKELEGNWAGRLDGWQGWFCSDQNRSGFCGHFCQLCLFRKQLPCNICNNSCFCVQWALSVIDISNIFTFVNNSLSVWKVDHQILLRDGK